MIKISLLQVMLLGLGVQAKAPLVAVNELSFRGVSANDATIITDRLRSELLQTGRVRILERSEMDQVLREQAFQQSGACDQSECAVQIGKLLSVDRMAVGSVGKIGELYTLSLRLLDVQTGEVLFTANEDFEGRLEGVLTQAVPRMALKLANGATNVAAKGATGTGRSELYVTTQDSDAQLKIDGAPINGRSPFTIEKLDAGPHELVAQGKLMYGTLTVNLGLDDIQKVTIPMSPMMGSAKFISDPPGARVLLDGAEYLLGLEETPFKRDGLPPGPHKVTFRKAGYLDTTVSVDIALGTVQTVRAPLNLGGILQLHASGSARALVIHGTDTSWIDANDGKLTLREGRLLVRVEDPRWEPVQQEIEIHLGKTSEVRFDLHPRPRTFLKVLADQPAEIHLDGELKGRTRPDSGMQVWWSDTLSAGIHNLLATSELRAPWQQDLTLTKGTTTPVVVKFKWSKDELDRRSRSSHLKWRIGLGLATAAAAGTAGFFQYLVWQYNDRANQAYADYSKAKWGFATYKSRYEAAQESAKNHSTAADIGWVAAGAFAAGLGLTWVF